MYLYGKEKDMTLRIESRGHVRPKYRACWTTKVVNVDMQCLG